MPDPRPEKVLSAVQRDVLKLFGTLRDSNEYCLSGAAALAGFYLAHRRSQDLDFFTSAEPLIESTGRELEEAGARSGFSCQAVRRFRTFAEFVVSRGSESTRVQLAQDSPFRLEPTTLTFENVRIESFHDLAANKLLAAFGRAAVRDLVDVYILVRDGHCSFDELERWAHRKDPGLDAYALAQSLRAAQEFPERSESLPIEMLVPLDVPDLKRVLSAEAVRLLASGLP